MRKEGEEEVAIYIYLAPEYKVRIDAFLYEPRFHSTFVSKSATSFDLAKTRAPLFDIPRHINLHDFRDF